MSLGTPGWNPGADALRAQQERARAPRSSSPGLVARLLGVLVVAAVLTAVTVVGLHRLNQSVTIPAPTNNQGCPSGALFCP